MGDMNFNEVEMSDAMEQAFHNTSPFSLYSPYCTNISPDVFNSKAIDHFLVYSPESTVVLNNPNQVMSGLDSIVSLLQKPNHLVSFVIPASADRTEVGYVYDYSQQ
jgi:hypothetical protein